VRASGLSAVRTHAGGPAASLRYPMWDQGPTRPHLQGGIGARSAGEWLVQFAVGCAFDDPDDLDEQIGPARPPVTDLMW
jgi:hypothetical protein